ncbi:MAG TPA: glycosyltransferase family 4 protein [Drouetiella sp.]|jgi:polysaccharide biosynthesis protein PslF
MKALIISAAFPPLRTGGADFIHRLASELAVRGVEVTVIASEGAVSHDDKIRLERVSNKWNWQTVQKCASMVRKIKPDVVDIVFTGWMYHDHPGITFLPVMIKQSFQSARVVVHIESLGGIRRDKSNFARAASRFVASLVSGRNGISYEYGTLLRDSDAIITLSERDRDELIKRDADVQRKSITISPPPIMPVVAPLSKNERHAGRRKLGLKDDGDLLLSFYGYVYPGKGLESLFEVVKRFHQQGRNVKLMIVGDIPEQYVLEREGKPDYLADLKKLARDLGINERIIWCEYAAYGSTEPSTKLRLSDICVFPFDSGINQHNSSFWFAAAHGLPIVATKSATTEDIFVDKQNVIFAEAANVSDLTSKIDHLSKDNALRERLGAESENLANTRFSWDSALDRTLAVFSGV